MQAINFEQNCAPHWGRAQGKLSYRTQRDSFVEKYLKLAARWLPLYILIWDYVPLCARSPP
jgi:hypothetical protein